jgi:hypothetical protein
LLFPSIADTIVVIGSTVSIVSDNVFESVDVLNPSLAFAVMLCSPSDRTSEVNVQSVPTTLATSRNIAPSYTSTVVPASVVPAISGVLSLVVASTVVITGAEGGHASPIKFPAGAFPE